MGLPSLSPAKDAALRDAGLLLLRATLGAGLLAHGLYLKIMVFGLPGTMGFFAQIGYPGWLGAAVALGEAAAGILLLAGVWTRLAAIAMIPVLAGATLQHAGNGWLFSATGGGWEFPAMWTALLAAQAMTGPGAWTLPALLRRNRGA